MSTWSSGKDYLLCNVALWFKSAHVILSLEMYTSERKKVKVNKLW